MDKHPFKPLKFRSPSGEGLSDWCGHFDVPFAQLAQMTPEEHEEHFCNKTKNDPVHQLQEEAKQ